MSIDEQRPERLDGASRNGDSSTSPSSPILAVPAEVVVSLEHPSIIKNIDNGLKSLGGNVRLNQVHVLLITLRGGKTLISNLVFVSERPQQDNWSFSTP